MSTNLPDETDRSVTRDERLGWLEAGPAWRALRSGCCGIALPLGHDELLDLSFRTGVPQTSVPTGATLSPHHDRIGHRPRVRIFYIASTILKILLRNGL